MAGGYLQMDETPIEYLSPGNGETRTGYFWTVFRPGEDGFYQWETSRAAECIKRIIPVDFRGHLQCDAYAGYGSFVRQQQGINLVGCWAHVRRKFFEAKEQAPTQAGWILNQIRHLYRIEKELREKKVSATIREVVRAHQAAPICARIFAALDKMNLKGSFLPRSNMGKAIYYALSNWNLLEVYLKQGQVEIDNNLVENAIRPTAVGKKNWLFIGDADAGQRSAVLFTIIECCRRRGINPYEYLRDVLSKLPTSTTSQIKDLTPKAWAKAGEVKVSPLKKAA